jgi:YfiR/HmsC-like
LKSPLLGAVPHKPYHLLGACCRWFLALVALTLWGGTATGAAKAEDSLEYAVKGAFLFKFGAFVEWPPSALPEPGAPFIIGILGEDPFGANLDQMVQNREVHGRPVVIKRYKRIEQARDAHILYISTSEKERLQEIAASLSGTSILTVSDESRQAGGIINFIIQENKVRFEIDAEAAERAGLKLSSKLLSLAKVIKNEQRFMKQ